MWVRNTIVARVRLDAGVHVVAVRRWLDAVDVARLREVPLQRELVVLRRVVGARVAAEAT
jgi:hypothetical protein